MRLDASASRSGSRSPARTVLRVAAAILAFAGLSAVLGSGLRLDLGPIHVSVTEPWRAFFQASVVWLVAELLAMPPSARRSVTLVAPALAIVVSGIADSSPRRVGDGAEYMAMALNMSHGSRPSLSSAELSSISAEMKNLQGFEGFNLAEPLVGSDGRQDFYHFWLYPLLASPFVATAAALHLHPASGFTAANVLGVLLLLWWLVRTGDATAAVLTIVGPLLWWIDKAHAEVLLFVTIALAALAIEQAPIVALLAAGIAAAQNPAAVIVLAGCIMTLLLRRQMTPSVRVATIGAIVIAAIAPAYYWWHLGVWSPLAGTVSRDLPGWRALATPLIDPNLGLLPYAPVLVVLAISGIIAGPGLVRLMPLASIAALLVVMAETPNVNHGGSPGMSRYALWLLALATPFVAGGCRRWEVQRPRLFRAMAVVSIIGSVIAFRPAWADRGGDSPNWLGSAMWTRWPSIDSPLPEVFSERGFGRDGLAVVPVATSRCEKVLIRGDGTRTWWPVPCAPREAPSMCLEDGVLCYVNAGLFVMAPPQPSFIPSAIQPYAWSRETVAPISSVLSPLGSDLRIIRLSDPDARVVRGRNVEAIYAVAGNTGTAVWVRGERESETIELDVTLVKRSKVEFLDARSLGPIMSAQVLPPGEHTIALAGDADALVLVSDAPD